MADADSIVAMAQAYADSLKQRAEAFVSTLPNVAQPTDSLVIACGPGLSIQPASFVDSISAILGQLNGQTLNAPAMVTPSAMEPTAPTTADLCLTSIASTDLTNLQVPDFTAGPAAYLRPRKSCVSGAGRAAVDKRLLSSDRYASLLGSSASAWLPRCPFTCAQNAVLRACRDRIAASKASCDSSGSKPIPVAAISRSRAQ